MFVFNLGLRYRGVRKGLQVCFTFMLAFLAGS